MLLVAVAAAAAAVVGWGDSYATRRSMDSASLQAGSALRLAVAALSGHLKRYEALPALLADHEDMKELVSHPQDPALRSAANAYLKEINGLLRSSDVYVLTPDGTTIAASNFDGPTSFVGQNFSYRPYFQDAVAGKLARFYAVGTTSARRGYFFSAPIDVDGRIAGVIVFKVDIDSIEASWRGGEYKIFVTDPEGIIFMSGSPDWLYRAIQPLTSERLARTGASRRYSDVTLSELSVRRSTLGGHGLMTIREGRESRDYLALAEYVPEADWTVNVLIDTAGVRAQARTIILAILLVLCIAGLTVAILLQRRARLAERMLLQTQARDELEQRVAERTEDLARVNRELRQTQADLVQAGKLAGLGQMSAALSHEFNQPLAAAKTYADSAALLIERNRLAEATDNLRRISSLIDRMASLSRHLRNFARKPNEKLGAVALDEVVGDAMDILSVRLAAADAMLVVDLGTPAPVVRAGLVRLQQVLVNIVSNAADAVEGLDDRRILLSATQRADRVILEIRDQGPGVPAAIAERIFDPFFTTKGVGKGLGLGLSISYNIVRDFGGNLSVANDPQGGAVFRIELDAAEAVAEAAE
ncbi:sensor histidine kinase [Rhizobium sp. CC-YZS058]|uniref:sensor histidine kinase n=1 Tax=Rhizobium sp. CC-YZS058 TaxID=3042153 RepID=UPI002B0624B9|nr:sensor histidine kinase [Rhizobium sp. CC-YZS058]MEA3534564.1 sensor histidine kinase [Rhizobium sp. CC-YZS058]